MPELNKINFNQNLGRPMGRQADLNSEGRISDVTRLEGELQIEGTVSARTMNAANSES